MGNAERGVRNGKAQTMPVRFRLVRGLAVKRNPPSPILLRYEAMADKEAMAGR